VDEKTDKIKEYIDTERERLGEDLQEIETRVKNATDLRRHFDKNTALILGATVAGGFVLSMLINKPSGNRTSGAGEFASSRADMTRRPISMSSHMHRVSETVDNIFAALVGVAAAKLSSFVGDAVPGFQEQYDQVEKGRGSSSVRQMPAV